MATLRANHEASVTGQQLLRQELEVTRCVGQAAIVRANNLSEQGGQVTWRDLQAQVQRERGERQPDDGHDPMRVDR